MNASKQTIAVLFAVVAGVLFACALNIAIGYVGDKYWELMAARMLVSGKKLYTDIFEVNPPLIFWLYMIPVYLARVTGWIEDYQLLALFGIAGVLLTVLLVYRLLAVASQDAYPPRVRFALCIVIGFAFIFINPVYFVDREHIFLVACFPYCLRFMPSCADKPLSLRLRVLIGAMAGIGFCIKPHCFIVWVAVQLAYIIMQRRAAILWSLENSIIYAISILYLAAIVCFTPDYIYTVLPIAVATYGGYKIQSLFYVTVAFFMAGGTFLEFRTQDRSPLRRDIYYFAAISLGALLYGLLNNGWGYTYFPLHALLFILAGWVWQEFSYLKIACAGHGASIQRFIFGANGCLMILLGSIGAAAIVYMVPTVKLMTSDCREVDSCSSLNDKLVHYIEQHDVHSFGILAIEFHGWPYLERTTHAALATRFYSLWMMPKLLTQDASAMASNQWIMAFVATAFASDLDRNRPDVVFVDTSPEFYHTGQSGELIAHLRVRQEFVRAWQHYHYDADIDTCSAKQRSVCRYTIYHREP